MADGVVEYDIRANTEYLEQDLNEAQNVAETGGNSLAEIAGKAAKAIGAAFAAAKIADGVKQITGLATDLEKSMNKFSASTGIAIESTENYEQVMKSIYANNYGEDFQDIADSIALVNRNLGEMSDEELQSITESAFALRDTFEYDVAESTRAAKAMMENFGISGDDAMSMIAAGAQNGLDYSGELIDSINEYSVQFAKMGLSADDMFSIFQAGAENGAWNLDKIGDAVKEMSIRVIDGSTTTAEGFAAIGLKAEDMAYKFTAGGDSARQAFQETLNALSSMEDPVAQDAAGVALLGTMWEDLGKDTVASLAGITGQAYDTENAMEGIKSVQFKDLDSMLEGLKRNLELVALPIGEVLIPQSKKMIETLVPLIQTYAPKIVDVITRIIKYGQELKSAVLDKLIAVFNELKEPVTQFISDLIPKLADLFKEIGTKITETAADFLPLLIKTFKTLSSEISGAVKNVLPKLMNVWNKIGQVFSDFINDILPDLISSFTSLIHPVMQLASEILPVLADIGIRLYDVFYEVAETVLKALADSFLTIAQAVLPLITEIIPQLLGLAVSLIEPLLSLIEAVLPALAEWFSAVAEVVSGIIEAVLPILIDLFNTLIPVIMDIVNTVLPAITNAFNVLKEPISDLIKSILPLLQEILKNVVKPAIDDMIPVIKLLAKMFSEVLANAIDNVTPIIKGIVDILKDVIDFIVNVFKGDWEGAWDSIKNAVLDAFNLIITGIENGINGAVWLINELINGINGITTDIGIDAIPNIPEVSLPRFHTGGIIDFKGKYEAPILAKDGEMVLTQEQQKRLFDIANDKNKSKTVVIEEEILPKEPIFNIDEIAKSYNAVAPVQSSQIPVINISNDIDDDKFIKKFEKALKNTQADSDIYLTVNIGQERFDDMVISSFNRYNSRTGGHY